MSREHMGIRADHRSVVCACQLIAHGGCVVAQGELAKDKLPPVTRTGNG